METESSPQPTEESADQTKPNRPFRIKIGSQREHDNSGSPAEQSEFDAVPPAVKASDADPAKPAVSTTDEPVNFPPPRVESIPQDVEDEIEKALSGVSIDQLLSGGDTEGSQHAELDLEQRYRGTVVKVHRENIFLSLPGRHEGVVSTKQLPEIPEPGKEMEVIVVGRSEEDGLYELSIPGASVHVGDWSDLTEGTVVDVRVTGHNSGGLECELSGIRGFIPISQVALYRVEDLEPFVDQKLPCVVTEANPARRNLVLSHRAVLERQQEEAKQKLLDSLEVGQVLDGVVRNIRDFGAFVDLGGVDGLIHVSQLSWDRVNHPSEVLEEGQNVKVKVDKFDRSTGKIGLSYRALLAHPWDNIESKYQANSIVTGTVSKIMDFGAFVRLEAGIEGLIHISELAHHHVPRVTSVVHEGQELEVKVLAVDRESQRMSLSLKAVQAVQTTDSDAPDNAPEEAAGAPTSSTDPPRRSTPLKGGTDRRSGGGQFGLNW